MLLITDTGPLTHASQTGYVGFLERILAPGAMSRVCPPDGRRLAMRCGRAVLSVPDLCYLALARRA